MVYIPPTLPTGIIPRIPPKPKPTLPLPEISMEQKLHKLLGIAVFEEGSGQAPSNHSDWSLGINRKPSHAEVPTEVTLPVIVMPGAITHTFVSHGEVDFVLVARKFGSSEDQWAPTSHQFFVDFFRMLFYWLIHENKSRIPKVCLKGEAFYDVTSITCTTDHLVLLTKLRELVASTKFRGFEFNMLMMNATIEKNQWSFLETNFGCRDLALYFSDPTNLRKHSWEEFHSKYQPKSLPTNGDESQEYKKPPGRKQRLHDPSNYYNVLHKRFRERERARELERKRELTDQILAKETQQIIAKETVATV